MWTRPLLTTANEGTSLPHALGGRAASNLQSAVKPHPTTMGLIPHLMSQWFEVVQCRCVPEFFLGFICNCLSYFTTAKISFTSVGVYVTTSN